MNPGQVAAGLVMARRKPRFGRSWRRQPLLRRPRRRPETPWGEPVTRHLRPMTTALRSEQTAGEAIDTLRGSPLDHRPAYLYVLKDGRLDGILPVRRLLHAAAEIRLETLAIPSPVTVPPTATMAQALEVLHQRRLLAVPVVDSEGRALGLIDVEQFASQRGYGSHLESQAVFQWMGMHLEEARTGRVSLAFRDRFPWLLANIGGGLLSAMVASRFEAVLAEIVALAMFLPVTLILSEGVSIQAMTLAVRSIQAGSAEGASLWRGLWRELRVASLLAVAGGALVAALAWLLRRESGVALVVGGAIALGSLVAATLGATIPALVHKLGRDPKVASGPLVLAATDVLTLTIYLSLAAAVLR